MFRRVAPMTKTGGVPTWELPCGCRIEHPRGAVRKVWTCARHVKESQALVLLKDMLGFLRLVLDSGGTPGVVDWDRKQRLMLETLSHDIGGFLEDQECFSPWVTGYWDKHLAARKETMRAEIAERKAAPVNARRAEARVARIAELMGLRAGVLVEAALPAIVDLEGCEEAKAPELAGKRSRQELAELIADRELRRGKL
jgi:hypothetical protein